MHALRTLAPAQRIYLTLICGMAITGGAVGFYNADGSQVSSVIEPATISLTKKTHPVVELQAGVIVDLLGLSTATGANAERSTEQLTFKASYRSSDPKASYAVFTQGGTELRYAVGERLPGGSHLRRIEPDRMVFWREGREEVLAIDPVAEVLRPVDPNASAQPIPFNLQHLRALAPSLSE